MQCGTPNSSCVRSAFSPVRSLQMKKTIAFASCLLFLAVTISCGGGKNVKDTSSDFSLDEKSGSTAVTRDRAKGVAAIFDNDRALARDRALNDARNKLVEKVLGTTITGESVMENYELVKHLVQAKSYGLVKKEKIIEEHSDADMYTVELEGTVEQAVVEDAIEEALNRYGKPKFMMLISETFENKMNAPGFTETEILMQERMGEAGFQFVDMQIGAGPDEAPVRPHVPGHERAGHRRRPEHAFE